MIKTEADFARYARSYGVVKKLPPGVTVHAVDRSLPLGEERRLAGHLIVELADGSMHRITGAEMTEWNEALSGYVRRWRISDEEERTA